MTDNSIDAIVSISALEHNPPEELPAVVKELMRVLKPGSPLVATLTASADQDIRRIKNMRKGRTAGMHLLQAGVTAAKAYSGFSV